MGGIDSEQQSRMNRVGGSELEGTELEEQSGRKRLRGTEIGGMELDEQIKETESEDLKSKKYSWMNRVG